MKLLVSEPDIIMTDEFPSTTEEDAAARSDSEDRMSNPTKCVLLACGSYNPVTNMHLRMFGK